MLNAEVGKSQSLSDEKINLSRQLLDTKTNLGIEEQQHVKTQRELISTKGTLEKSKKDLTDTKQELDAVSAGLAQTCQELDEYKNKLKAAEKLIADKDKLIQWAKETEDKLNAEIDKLKKEKSDLHKSLEST